MSRLYEQCAVNGCTESVAWGLRDMMCRPHYATLPLSLRNEIWDARRHGSDSLEHRRAVSRALLWHTDAGKLYGSDG